MSAAHTPGPWRWNEHHQLVSDGATEYPGTDDWMDPEPKRIVETDGGHYPPHGADRALIAAAPDLLAALIQLADETCAEEGLQTPDYVLEAIQKATRP